MRFLKGRNKYQQKERKKESLVPLELLIMESMNGDGFVGFESAARLA